MSESNIVFGRTSGGVYYPVQVDSAGMLFPQQFGWVGGAWQKQPILQGYSDVIRGAFENLSLGAGTNSIDGATVPAGEVWVIEAATIMYTGTVTSVVLFLTIELASSVWKIFSERGITSGHAYSRTMSITLKEGENLRWICQNATAGDDGRLEYVGRKYLVNA